MKSQRQLELDALSQGSLAILRQEQTMDLRRRHQETQTSYGQKLLPVVLEGLRNELVDYLSIAASGKPGRRASALALLADTGLKPDVISMITARVVIDQISATPPKLTGLAITLGKAIQTEALADLMNSGKKNKAFLAHTLKLMNKQTNNRVHRYHCLRRAGREIDIGLDWSTTKCLQIGVALLELLARFTGIIRIRNRTVGHNKLAAVVEPTEQVIDWIMGGEHLTELFIPSKLPLVDRPKPWADLYTGGYSFGGKQPCFVKSRGGYVAGIGDVDFSGVYAAVNTLQDTQWKVNQGVLDVALRMANSGQTIGKLASARTLELPPKPYDIDTNEEARRSWRKAAAEVHQFNNRSTGRLVQSRQLLQCAEELQDDGFYFPYQLDFRGRGYTMPNFLTYQGNDLARGMLRFSEGKPIAEDGGLYWLQVHAANVYGEDKCSLDERVEWADQHRDLILQVGDDPCEQTWWLEADKPWQFLAACKELAGYYREGDGFVSSIPVPLDGSCNGLQHFSAMLRDPIGGAAVNLVPMDVPQDIYGRVADVTVAKLKQLDHPFARDWLDYGVDRSITKRPVMVLPYGGTMFSCREYVYASIEEREEKGCHSPWLDPTDKFKASLFLAQIIWQSIGEVVVAARQAMGWLQSVARLVGPNPIRWVTPDGFVAWQRYPRIKDLRVETLMFGACRKLTISEETDKVDTKRQRNGVSPNFVHSMDATAMRRYVDLAKTNGISSFAVVHDAFGTLAADTDLSVACIKRAFVNMYAENNVLDQFRHCILQDYPELADQLPPIPPMGSLDIHAVLDSEYFFA